MSFVIKLAKTLRNNWKKSTFAAVIITYGGIRTKRYIDTNDLMRAYCEKAAQHGKQTIPVHEIPRSVTVILNPNANKRNAANDFEKYCAPLLHLAGIDVQVIKTDAEGHAKTLIESLNGAESIVVAGGDGTLSEVVTGLLRRSNENSNGLVPIGVLPLGRNSTVARTMFPGEKNVARVRSLAEATMAVIEEVTKPADVMKIEIIDEESEEPHKPVYAVAGIQWGAFRDAEVKKDDYWYFGSLRNYMTYLFNGAKSSLTWNCEASINYSPPCEGCSNCYKKQSKPSSRWFQGFVKGDDNQKKFLSVTNPDCQKTLDKKISTTDLALLTSNAIQGIQDIPKLHLRIGPEPETVHYVDFVRQGWQSVNGKDREVKEIIEAKTIEIKPEKVQRESWFSIDNENYEVKPIRITLLPKIINMYCKKSALINT